MNLGSSGFTAWSWAAHRWKVAQELFFKTNIHTIIGRREHLKSVRIVRASLKDYFGQNIFDARLKV